MIEKACRDKGASDSFAGVRSYLIDNATSRRRRMHTPVALFLHDYDLRAADKVPTVIFLHITLFADPELHRNVIDASG